MALKKLKLSSKVMLTVTSLIILTIMVSIIITLYFGNNIGKDIVANKLESSQLIQKKFTNDRGRQLELISLLMASDPAFIAYIAQAIFNIDNEQDNIDTASISDILLERKQQYGFDLALIVTADSYQIARSDMAMAAKRDLSEVALIKKATEQLLPDSGFYKENGAIYQAAIVPLARGQNLLGFLITGLKINDAFADEISKLSGTEVVVAIKENQQLQSIASSLDVNYTNSYIQQINNTSKDSFAKNKLMNLPVNELNLATNINHLSDASQNAFILTGISVNQILQPFYNTRNTLLIVGLGLIFLTFVVASVFVKKALSSLTKISSSTYKIAQGNYDEKLPEHVSDDLSVLKSSITKLSNKIRGRDAVAKHMIEISKKSHLTKTTGHNASPKTSFMKIGDVIGKRFEVIQNLGVGGMGHVFQAIDLELDEIVALKVLKNTYQQQQDINKFKDEIRLARRISHPNVVRIHDFGQIKGHVFISMEYVQGYTLEQIIKHSIKLRPYAARYAAIHICQGLMAAHASGVVHRDLKPANIIVELDSSIKLMDFGIATAQSSISKEKKHDLVEGSSSYLSQEQILGKGSDERSDIYAIGVLLMEMFTGKRPFYGDSEQDIMLKHVQEEPTPISQYWSDCPIALEKLILKCLSKNPKDRYQSVQGVLNDLLKIKFS